MSGQSGGMDDNSLDTLLRQTDPYAPSAPAAALTTLSRELATEVASTTRSSRARALWSTTRGKVATIVAVSCLAVPTAAYAAEHFLAQTGTFSDAKLNPDFADGSELIDVCAPDYKDYLRAQAPTDIALPAGVTWDGLLAQYLKNAASDMDACNPGHQGMQGAGSIKATWLQLVSESWGCAAIRADVAGDNAAIDTAATAMVAINKRLNAVDTFNTHDYTADIAIANSQLPQWVGGCGR